MRRPDQSLHRIALLILLQGCAGSAPPPPEPVAISAALPAPGPEKEPVCRVGPDGGPPRRSERGIGGTGAPPALLADRGIGGTGIVGVITGFASLCVAGREVAYAPDLPIVEDGRTTATTALRAGQVAMVEADATLTARRVAIRHEVVGPVQGPEQGLLRIAGQRVAVSQQTLGLAMPPAGAWVAVSGFRDGEDVIHATRIDRVRPGGAGAEGQGTTGTLVRGSLLREGGTIRIGTLEVRPAPGLRLPSEQRVVVTGRWMDGILLADNVQTEPGPAAQFGPRVAVVVIEGYAGLNQGRLVLTRSEGGRTGEPARRSVVELERRPDGTLHPAMVRDLAPAGRAGLGGGAEARGGQGVRGPSRAIQPAPMPNRATDGPRGGGGAAQSPEPSGRPGMRGRGAAAGDAGATAGGIAAPTSAPGNGPPRGR